MSPGSGAEFCRSDYVIPQHCGGETGPRAHDIHSGSEYCRSSFQYINNSPSIEVI
jgi:hypothetical protein